MWMPVTATACTVTQAPALRPPNDLSHEVPPQAGPTLPGIPALVDVDKVLQTRSKAVPRHRATVENLFNLEIKPTLPKGGHSSTLY